MASLTAWVHGIAPHTSETALSTANPFQLIKDAHDGKAFRCVEYSRLLAAVLCANGYPARVVKLKIEHADQAVWGAGHVVTEAFLPSLKQWILLDGQFNVVAVEGGVPISVYQAASVLNQGRNISSINPIDRSLITNYSAWLSPYLYYLQVPLGANRYGVAEGKELMYVPPGATPLHTFQKSIALKKLRYTYKIDDLYASTAEDLPIACH